MKTNKKTVLGFAVAMVFSLAFMQGNSMKIIKQDMSVQQIGLAASIGATYAEQGGATQAGLNYIANNAGNVSSGLALAGISAPYISGTNPVGWGFWGTTAAIGL